MMLIHTVICVVVRNGSNASSVTIQGDMVVPKFLPLKGPSGVDSYCCMSLADQSFIMTKPKI